MPTTRLSRQAKPAPPSPPSFIEDDEPKAGVKKGEKKQRRIRDISHEKAKFAIVKNALKEKEDMKAANFPTKVFLVLEEAEQHQFEDIISWVDGRW